MAAFKLRPVIAAFLVLTYPALVAPLLSQRPSRLPLSPADVTAITRLVMLEDTRQFDEATLAALLKSAHPEVRRRAVLAVARIVNPAGRALLAAARTDKDADILATVAFASGQIKDPDSVSWLSQLLESPRTPVAGRPRGRLRARQDPHARGPRRARQVPVGRSRHAGCNASHRGSTARDRPLYDEGGPDADRAMGNRPRPRGPLARRLGAVPPARSGGGGAAAEALRRPVSRCAVLGDAGSRARSGDGRRPRSRQDGRSTPEGICPTLTAASAPRPFARSWRTTTRRR